MRLRQTASTGPSRDAAVCPGSASGTETRSAKHTETQLSASYGALTDPGPSGPNAGRRRSLDVAVRVGSPQLDNTHKLRGEWSWGGFGRSASLPIEDDPEALRVAVWRATDGAYKAAVRQLIRVKTNEQVKVEAEDKADDFSLRIRDGIPLPEPYTLEEFESGR